MGVREVLKMDPLKAAMGALEAPGEKIRRQDAHERRQMLEDDVSGMLARELGNVVDDKTKRDQIAKFAGLAGALNLFKRVVNAIAGHAYSSAPTRRASPDSEQEALNLLAKETRLNRKLDKGCILTHAQGAVFFYPRFVGRLQRVVLDVLPIDCLTVIPDPDDPTAELAVIYDREILVEGKKQIVHVFWDDTEAFQFDGSGQPVLMALKDGSLVPVINKSNGHPGVLPFVAAHLNERANSYWELGTGKDLAAAQGALSFVVAQVLRVLKIQGHSWIGVNGDPGSYPKSQVLDPEVPLFAGEGNQLTQIQSQAQPDNFLKVADHIMLGAAANYGLNREQMNQTSSSELEMVGLLERRQRAINLFVDVEQRLFEKLKLVARQHSDPARRLADSATMSVDFAEVSHKVERLKLLEIWKQELRMGLTSVWDIVRADQPEIGDDEAAKKEVQNNLESFTWLIEEVRTRLNISLLADAGQPGQSAQANGAMGPAVRDGEMKRDDAAAQAKGAALPQENR